MGALKFLLHGLIWMGLASGAAAAAAPDIAARSESGVPILPLSEIRPGMKGEWRTVIAGVKIEEFDLEVLGVAENFISPGRSLIICHAIDDDNILSGPVSGMSGSPVFIDGKLIGAYAYGFMWAKEQAIIGVTPIEDMLEVFDRFDSGERGERTASVSGTYPRWMDDGDTGTGEFAAAGMEWDFAGRRPPVDLLKNRLQPLPTPLSVAGFSPAVLAHFGEYFREFGFEPSLVPMGRAAEDIEAELIPGAAVAGVLLDGDFSIAGTGTITYRDGERILAFGHPFFGIGATEIPMASAEIMTVVRSVVSSFKLSNTGPVVGSIYQDRLSAIAGEIGRMAPTTRLQVNVSDSNGQTRQFQGNLFRHPRLSPLVSGMALAESLTQTLEAATEQTFFIESRWEIEGYEPVVLRDVASGPMAPFRVAMRQMQLFNQVLNNPFSEPSVLSIVHDISIRDEWLISELDSVYADRSWVRPGGTVNLTAVLRNYRGERSVLHVPVEIPARLRPGEYTVFLGSGSAAVRRDPHMRTPPTSMEQILKRVSRQRSNAGLHAMLLENTSGVSVEGQTMPNVLPSVTAVLSSSNSRSTGRNVGSRVIWETAVDVDAEVTGERALSIEVRR